MRVLSKADRDFLDEHGYLVVKAAVPTQACDAVVQALCEFNNMKLDDPETWYEESHNGGGWSHIRHHPAMWQTRSSERLYAAFADIWGSDHLSTSMDIANIKSPIHPDHPGYGDANFLHWDQDPWSYPYPFNVQGVLSLTDTVEGQGGFQCLPGYHKVDPADMGIIPHEDPRHNYFVDVEKFEPVPILTEAGDFVIWNRGVPHGAGQNHTDKPRCAQYITMGVVNQDDEDNEEKRVERIQNFEEGVRSEGHSPERILNELGRKLVGYDRWDGPNATETIEP